MKKILSLIVFLLGIMSILNAQLINEPVVGDNFNSLQAKWYNPDFQPLSSDGDIMTTSGGILRLRNHPGENDSVGLDRVLEGINVDEIRIDLIPFTELFLGDGIIQFIFEFKGTNGDKIQYILEHSEPVSTNRRWITMIAKVNGSLVSTPQKIFYESYFFTDIAEMQVHALIDRTNNLFTFKLNKVDVSNNIIDVCEFSEDFYDSKLVCAKIVALSTIADVVNRYYQIDNIFLSPDTAIFYDEEAPVLTDYPVHLIAGPDDSGDEREVVGVDVTLDGGYFNETVPTGSDGIAIFTGDNIKKTIAHDINPSSAVFQDSDLNMTPYLWSSNPLAFGSNNQTNMVRKIDSDSVFMTYTNGTNIIWAQSGDFGDTWEADYVQYEYPPSSGTFIRAAGNHPSLLKASTGIICSWKDGLALLQTHMQSPWVPIDTVFPEALDISEPSVCSGAGTKKYMATIEYDEIGFDQGDLYFSYWNDVDVANITKELVWDEAGTYGVVPCSNPVINQCIYSSEVIPVIGSIDNANMFKVAYKYNFIWTNQDISESSCIARNPGIDYDGYSTTFVWEIDNEDGTSDVWKREYNEQDNFNAEQQISFITGINTYPINKNRLLTALINNDNKLIAWHEAISSIDYRLLAK